MIGYPNTWKEWNGYVAAVNAVRFGANWRGQEGQVTAAAMNLAVACEAFPRDTFPEEDVKWCVFGICLPRAGSANLVEAMRRLVNVSNFLPVARAIMAALPVQLRQAGFGNGAQSRWAAPQSAPTNFSWPKALEEVFAAYGQFPLFYDLHNWAAIGHALFAITPYELARSERNFTNGILELLRMVLRERRSLPGRETTTMANVLLRMNAYDGVWMPSLAILFRSTNECITDGKIFFNFSHDLCLLFAKNQVGRAIFIRQLTAHLQLLDGRTSLQQKHLDITPFHMLCVDQHGALSPNWASIVVYQSIWQIGDEYDFHNASGNTHISIQRPNANFVNASSANAVNLRNVTEFQWFFECMCENFAGTTLNPIQLAFSASNSPLRRMPAGDQSRLLAQMVLCFMCVPSGRALNFLVDSNHGISTVGQTTILEHVRTLGFEVRIHISKLLEGVEARLDFIRRRNEFPEEVEQLRRFTEMLRRIQRCSLVSRNGWINIADWVRELFGGDATFHAIGSIEQDFSGTSVWEAIANCGKVIMTSPGQSGMGTLVSALL